MLPLPDPALFAFALIDTGAVLFLLVYFVIILSDLECDYLNAQQCCSKLNIWVLPKVAAHVVLCFLIVIGGHWTLFFLNAPMIAWLVYDIFRQPAGSLGIYDPIEIHNRGMIKVHLRNCMIYLGYYLIMFFIYLYCLISSLLKGDPIRRHEDGEIVTEF